VKRIMYLRLKNLQIQKKYLTKVNSGVQGFLKIGFSGFGIEDEGKRITDRLREFKVGDKGIDFEATTTDGREYVGTCEILSLKIEEPEPGENRGKFRFSGELKKEA